MHEDHAGRLWIQIGGSVVFYEGGRFNVRTAAVTTALQRGLIFLD